MDTIKEKPKKIRIRRSEKAYNVANEIIYRIKNKKPINLKQIAVENGYTEKSAHAQKPYLTDTFKDTIAPVLNKMKAIHEKALQNIGARDYSKERLDSVVNVARQMVHDTQLLQGKATENVASNVVVYGSDDFLTLQTKGKIDK